MFSCAGYSCTAFFCQNSDDAVVSSGWAVLPLLLTESVTFIESEERNIDLFMKICLKCPSGCFRISGWWQHSTSQHPAHRGATRWQGQHHQSGLEHQTIPSCWERGRRKTDAECLSLKALWASWCAAAPDPGHLPTTIYVIYLLCSRTVFPFLYGQQNSIRNTRKKKLIDGAT